MRGSLLEESRRVLRTRERRRKAALWKRVLRTRTSAASSTLTPAPPLKLLLTIFYTAVCVPVPDLAVCLPPTLKKISRSVLGFTCAAIPKRHFQKCVHPAYLPQTKSYISSVQSIRRTQPLNSPRRATAPTNLPRSSHIVGAQVKPSTKRTYHLPPRTEPNRPRPHHTSGRAKNPIHKSFRGGVGAPFAKGAPTENPPHRKSPQPKKSACADGRRENDLPAKSIFRLKRRAPAASEPVLFLVLVEIAAERRGLKAFKIRQILMRIKKIRFKLDHRNADV